MKLTVPASIYEKMIEHCKAGLPNEACGFLGGKAGNAETYYPLTNAASSPVYYRPNDREMIAAITQIEDSGQDLVAIFHSHVASPPMPSPTDIREAHYPDAVYVIVSLLDLESPEVRGWKIRKKEWSDSKGETERVDVVIS